MRHFDILAAMEDGVRGHVDGVPQDLHDPRLAPRPHGSHLSEGIFYEGISQCLFRLSH